MPHTPALACASIREVVGTADRFVKQLATSDRYFGTPEFLHQRGLVQQLPLPGPLMMRRNFPLPAA